MAIGFVLVAYAAVGEPLLGRWFYARFRRRRGADPRALVRFYGTAAAVQWAWAAAVAAVLVLSPGLAASDLGLRLPHNWAPILGAAAGAGAVFLVFHLLTRASRGRPAEGPGQGGRPAQGPGGPPDDALGAVAADLAPQTRRERRAAAVHAVTAGICEELLYRGLFVALGVGLGLPVWAAAVLSCVLFAVAHVYQGWWGLVGPGVLGAAAMVLYLVTGSLIVAIVAHVLINLRSVLAGGGRRGAGPGSPGGGRGGSRGGRRAKGRRHRPAAA
ncbi:CAAX prenyl protease-like protein [Murinocardiopsis flavida]|uniref:CAAX prenyl protease-like protein n=2 Tax=Murinocardiopsis flavida TaxID=645275 RepID=A0A2P8DJ27_9ACTN|nr:CAAX prenyl protease-like protein [Murinocardiopsis flavida]